MMFDKSHCVDKTLFTKFNKTDVAIYVLFCVLEKASFYMSSLCSSYHNY